MPLSTTQKTTSSPIAPAQAAMPSTYGALPVTGFIRQRELLEIIPISSSTLWRRVRAGTFIAPTKLSERVTAWRAEDVRQWLAAQGAQGAQA